ncbi:hypothetical protein DLJ54_07165 [Corynebacterium heidelbergense]|uniref:ABC-2 type transporter transmembrane domain-containing protein n=2 Tax=Corynebacterium heidelbergense TaxID=2055947 RepID=A0A364V4X4_9CORY|nr:hypothetical protein DLJ54_07165 [Corynebacterium heidelbergense]
MPTCNRAAPAAFAGQGPGAGSRNLIRKHLRRKTVKTMPYDPAPAGTAPAPISAGPKNSAAGRFRSLARAEWLQFRRNRVMIFLLLTTCIGLPVFVFTQLNGGNDPATRAVRNAATFDVMLILAGVNVLFYSILSMATTRRDEGVLKRLRTGEARDIEILAALCTPGTTIVVGVALALGVGCAVVSGQTPANALFLVAGTLGFIVVAGSLALLTSAVTKNAEASQVTSLPMYLLAIGSMGVYRGMLPDWAQDLAKNNPFGNCVDLVYHGWGAASEGMSAGGWEALIKLAVWCVILGVAARYYMRWETHR